MIIRNKLRGLNNPQNIQHKEPYEPEYKRLGITPMEPYVRNITTIAPPVSSIPKNIRVNSGQNEDLAWAPNQRSVKNPQSKVHDDNEEIVYHDVRSRTFINENFEDGVNNKPIEYDDVPDFPRNAASDSNNSNSVSLFKEVTVGEYVLIFENEILGSGSLKEVTDAVEELLLADKSGSISANSLIVLKRMQIMTGVIINDV